MTNAWFIPPTGYKGVRKYEYLRLYITPERTPLDKEHNRKVREIAEQVKAERPLTQNTKHSYQKILIAALNHAVREGLMASNPFMSLPANERIPEKEGDREFLTIEEQKKLFATPCSREDVRVAFIFSCLTGLRKSDIVALCPKHIKTSPDGKSKYIEIEQEKTEDKVIVPLHEEALKYLSGTTAPDEHYFTLPSTGGICKVLTKWAEAAGITKHITFHSDRHTFATLSMTAGSELKTVSTLLGHSSVGTTTIYADVEMKSKKDAVKGLSALFR